MTTAQTLWSPRDIPPQNLETERLRLFCLQATAELGRGIAHALGLPLASHEEREFEDGEHKARPLDAVGGTDVYVVQSLHGGPSHSPHDKLARLLFFIGALKDAGAARVTAVVPYLCYSRKDRRTKPNDPVTTRYIAALFEAMGTDAVATVEVHNPTALENAWRRPAVALSATPLFVEHARTLAGERLCVVSPDPGGVKRAELFRETLEAALGRPIDKGFVDKHRSGGKISGDLFVGDAEGATVLVIDDLISTGNTLLRAARATRRAGARRVIAMAAHGLFTDGAAEILADAAIEQIVITDTVPAFRLGPGPARDKLEILRSAPLIAEAIGRLHAGRPLTDLAVV